jgi:hypothetical protein
MAEFSKKLGKLSLAILENFVETKLGKKFVEELRAPTERTLAMATALELTQDRFTKEFEDKVFSERILSTVNEKSLSLLAQAVGKFYEHPTDPDFPIALQRLIVTDFPYFPIDRVERGIAEYIALLTEELILVDETFRQNASAIAAVRSERWEKQILDALRERSLVSSSMPLANFIPGSAPLPPSLVVGREQDIKILKERLISLVDKQDSTRLQVLTAIRGWPGVGKTTLATMLAYDQDIMNKYPDGTLWISLGTEPSILSCLATWGRALGVDDLMKEKTVQDASSRLSAILRHKRMLLIIDDVWEVAHSVPFRVGGPGCTTLITTRAHDVAQALAGTPDNIYRLNVLTEEQSLELLSDIAPIVVQEFFQACRELAQDLEGLPLALQVAGHLLNVEKIYGFSVVDLLQDLRSGKKILESKAPADRSDLANETTPAVAVLFQKSTDRLDEHTRDCFAVLGVFAPKPATFDLLALKSVWQVEDPKPIVRALVDRGLLEPILALERYQMHALLVAHAKSLLRFI